MTEPTARGLKKTIEPRTVPAENAKEADSLLEWFPKNASENKVNAWQYRLDLLMQHMGEPLFELDSEGRILFVNNSALALTEMSEQTLLSKNFFELFHKDHVKRIKEMCTGLKDKEVTFGVSNPLTMQNRMIVGRLIPLVASGNSNRFALIQDITATKMAEDALSKGRANFYNIVNKNTDGIIVTSTSGTVLFINPVVETLFGRSADEIVGHPLEFSLAANDKGFSEITIQRENGQDGVAEMRTVDTMWQGQPAHLITLRDITARKEWEKTLERAKLSADEASKAKSEFLANMSHELRSPLNAMLLLAQDLADDKKGNLTDGQLESIHVIHQAGKSLLFLINDILDLAKIEAGRMHIYIRRVRLTDLADQIKSLFSHMAESKGLGFNVTVEDSLPTFIITDHQKLEQVLRNLVSNAIKFTVNGSIEIHFFKPLIKDFKLSTTGKRSQGIIAVAVSDTGIGIPKDKQEVIFEAFQQADGSTSRKFGGTGLGLSISQKLSETMGGHIQLVSQKGKGSTFTLYLPETIELKNSIHSDRRIHNRRSKEPPTLKRQQKLGHPRSATPKKIRLIGKKIILMDPEPRRLFTLANALENHGMKIHRAVEPAKVLTILKNETNINAVVISIPGPGRDPQNLFRKVREIAKSSHLPMLALVDASAASSSGRKCFRLQGVDEILELTVSLDKLVEALDRNISS